MTLVPGVVRGGFAGDVPNCLVTSQESLLGEGGKHMYVLSSCIYHPAAFKISVLYYYYYCYYLFFFLSVGPGRCQAQRVLSSQHDLIYFTAEKTGI